MAIFTDIKTLTAQAAAETAPTTTATNYVTVDGRAKNQNITRLMEFRLKNASVANAPASVSFDVWRLVDGVRDPLGTWTVLGADITAGKVQPITLETWGNEVMVTLSAFSGGTSPTFTGTIQARPLE